METFTSIVGLIIDVGLALTFVGIALFVLWGVGAFVFGLLADGLTALLRLLRRPSR